MKTITSFTVDHLTLLPGLYVSRVDTMDNFTFTTFDLRVTRPNFEPVMDTSVCHTIEHLGATYFRNKYPNDTMEFIILFEGKIPGASAIECGNYLDLNLDMAKYYARKYLEVLKNENR